MHELLESPAVSFVGRHNSGKTTISVAVIAELTRRGLDVGSIKHHGHAGFAIDVPGKDSFRHREAGATETVIASPDSVARIRNLDREVECRDLLATMPGHDIVIVEGYRASGIPMIEVMRQKSHRDLEAASQLLEYGFDSPAFHACDGRIDVDAQTVAVASDIPVVLDLAARSDRRTFELPDSESPAFGEFVGQLCDFIEERFARERVTLAIQAGGESRRMGQSKALVDFDGQPLIARMIERLKGAADEIVITTNEADRLSFLPGMFPDVNLRLAPDVYEERGALAGFVTAFEAARYDIVAVVACDLALASAELIAAETSLLRRSGADAVAPYNNHGYEPLHAVYRKSACAPIARTLVEQGDMRVHDLLYAVDVREMSQDEVRRFVPAGGCFANVNTPEELEDMIRHAQRRGE